MKEIEFVDGKVSNDQGYIMYRKYDDNVYVLMGSYTDKEHRGKGVFKNLFNELLDEVGSDGVIEAAASSKILAKYLMKVGFVKIKEPVRYWGKISNGVNLKMIKM